MGTTEKLATVKEIMATAFMHATEKSMASGLHFAYKSYAEVADDTKIQVVDILVKEAGYGERTIQQFKYIKPDQIEFKRFELQVLLDVLSHLIQGALITWYETAKLLATDTELQKTIIDETKKSNIASF
jgi:hypothetical protein